MKKRSKHKPLQTSIPMIVNRLVHQNIETAQEHSIILAFQFGLAQKEHFDWLGRMSNMLNIALQIKPSETGLQLVAAFSALSKRIFSRYEKTGKLGVAGEELVLLRKLVGECDQFWKRESTSLYNQCVAELNAFYLDLAEQRKVA